MTRRMIIALTLSLCFAVATPAFAQDQPDPEKVVLLKKLFSLMNLKAIGDSILNSSLGEMEQQMLKGMEGVFASDSGLTEKQRADLQRGITEFSKRVSAKFLARMKQKIDFAELTERIMLPAYAREFSTPEIKDMVAFYESPTGQKMVKALPQLTQEAMQKTAEAIMPQVMQLVNEVMEEEKESFANLLKAAGVSEPPPPPPPAPKTKKPVKKP